MPTIIRKYAAPASFPDTLIMFPEPAIDFPAAGLVGSWRFGKNAANSMRNEVEGGWGDMAFVSANPPTMESNVGVFSDAGYFIVPGRFANPPLSIITVAQFAVPRANHQLGGYSSQSAAGLTLNSSSRGSVVANARKDGTTFASATAALPSTTTRYEFVAAVFDNVENTATIHIPRVGVANSVPVADWGNSTNVYRIGATASPVRIARHAIYSRALATAEVQGIYESMRDSLSASGIDI